MVAGKPFGGSRMSVIGPIAIGKFCLQQLRDPFRETENALRRGFAPGQAAFRPAKKESRFIARKPVFLAKADYYQRYNMNKFSTVTHR